VVKLIVMGRVRDKYITEKEKISQMNRDQKWDYFKTYYLAKTIVLFVAIVLFIWFVKDTFFQKKIANAGCVYGVEISEEEKVALTEGYLDYYSIDKKKYGAYISTDNMFEDTEQKMDANAHEMALFAQIAAGEIYYLILDKENFEKMSNGGIFASLDEVFADEGLPEEIKDRTVKIIDKESGVEYNAAIDLRGTGLFNDDTEAYLVFTIGIPDKEYPKRFLDYIFEL